MREGPGGQSLQRRVGAAAGRDDPTSQPHHSSGAAARRDREGAMSMVHACMRVCACVRVCDACGFGVYGMVCGLVVVVWWW
jgi:hypothetical protein